MSTSLYPNLPFGQTHPALTLESVSLEVRPPTFCCFFLVSSQLGDLPGWFDLYDSFRTKISHLHTLPLRLHHFPKVQQGLTFGRL